MSAPIYELLKRPDELFVVEHAHLQPRFVEDSVRLSLKGALDALPALADGDFLFARQVNLETIHAHDVLAEREGTVGELRSRARVGHRRPRATRRSPTGSPPLKPLRSLSRCRASAAARAETDMPEGQSLGHGRNGQVAAEADMSQGLSLGRGRNGQARRSRSGSPSRPGGARCSARWSRTTATAGDRRRTRSPATARRARAPTKGSASAATIDASDA